MKKIALFCVVGIIIGVIVGCGSTLRAQKDKFRAENRANLSKLSLGMSKAEVLDIMGVETIEHKSTNPRDGAGLLNPLKATSTNPHRVETYTVDSLTLEVLYYHTDVKKLDGAISDDELTPIIIIDDKLSGWGWSYWDDTAAKYEIRLR